MKVLGYLLAVLLCVASPAYAQKTSGQLNSEITAAFTSNGQGGITGQALRNTTLDIINSIMPAAPVANGGQACFSGTTGLLQDCGSSPVSVTAFGAKCDGVTNDAAALQAAFNSGAGVVRLPEGRTCFSSSGLTVSNNTSVISEGNPTANPTTGAIILCANSVSVCLTLSSPTSGSSGQGGISVRGFGVGFSGAPAAGSIAIKVATTWLPHLMDMQAFNAAIGYEFVATGIYGISTRTVRLSTCQITDAHIVLDGWAEFRGTQLRLGCNNDGVNSNDYIRLQNTQGGPSNTPNTVTIENSQFNAGGSQVGCWLHFIGIGGTKNEFTFAENHLEAVNAVICSDSTSSVIGRLVLANNTFLDNSSSHPFFNLNAATAINDWTVTGNLFLSWTGWTLAPAAQINALIVTGNRFNGPPVSITGVSNSTIDFEGNVYSGVTLAGSFAKSIVKGTNTAGSLVNNATGPIEFPAKTAWTPGIAFGGASVGVTYTTQTGQWQINGNALTYSFVVTLSAVGSSTGAATITGVPQSCNQPATAAIYNASMSTLGGAPLAASTNGATANLYQDGSGGIGTLSNSNFTATSSIQGTITCLM